jgi:hypothetical protein
VETNLPDTLSTISKKCSITFEHYHEGGAFAATMD